MSKYNLSNIHAHFILILFTLLLFPHPSGLNFHRGNVNKSFRLTFYWSGIFLYFLFHISHVEGEMTSWYKISFYFYNLFSWNRHLIVTGRNLSLARKAAVAIPIRAKEPITEIAFKSAINQITHCDQYPITGNLSQCPTSIESIRLLQTDDIHSISQIYKCGKIRLCNSFLSAGRYKSLSRVFAILPSLKSQLLHNIL